MFQTINFFGPIFFEGGNGKLFLHAPVCPIWNELKKCYTFLLQFLSKNFNLSLGHVQMQAKFYQMMQHKEFLGPIDCGVQHEIVPLFNGEMITAFSMKFSRYIHFSNHMNLALKTTS